MQIQIPYAWPIFCVAFGAVLLTSFIMSKLAQQFYTFKIIKRRFSIMELEFPSNPSEISFLVQGIFELPEEQSRKTIRALRAQLWVDFLFMPAAYGAIFLLCMQFSAKITTGGSGSFAVIAWLQIIPFVCDVIENIHLLSTVGKNIRPQRPAFFQFYKILEFLKWGIALFGFVCAVSLALYFWFSGYYEDASLRYPLIIAGEIAGIIFLSALLKKKKEEQKKAA